MSLSPAGARPSLLCTSRSAAESHGFLSASAPVAGGRKSVEGRGEGWGGPAPEAPWSEAGCLRTAWVPRQCSQRLQARPGAAWQPATQRPVQLCRALPRASWFQLLCGLLPAFKPAREGRLRSSLEGLSTALLGPMPSPRPGFWKALCCPLVGEARGQVLGSGSRGRKPGGWLFPPALGPPALPSSWAHCHAQPRALTPASPSPALRFALCSMRGPGEGSRGTGFLGRMMRQAVAARHCE